jgi:hypothetical protein
LTEHGYGKGKDGEKGKNKGSNEIKDMKKKGTV